MAVRASGWASRSSRWPRPRPCCVWCVSCVVLGPVAPPVAPGPAARAIPPPGIARLLSGKGRPGRDSNRRPTAEQVAGPPRDRRRSSLVRTTQGTHQTPVRGPDAPHGWPTGWPTAAPGRARRRAPTDPGATGTVGDRAALGAPATTAWVAARPARLPGGGAGGGDGLLAPGGAGARAAVAGPALRPAGRRPAARAPVDRPGQGRQPGGRHPLRGPAVRRLPAPAGPAAAALRRRRRAGLQRRPVRPGARRGQRGPGLPPGAPARGARPRPPRRAPGPVGGGGRRRRLRPGHGARLRRADRAGVVHRPRGDGDLAAALPPGVRRTGAAPRRRADPGPGRPDAADGGPGGPVLAAAGLARRRAPGPGRRHRPGGSRLAWPASPSPWWPVAPACCC